MEEGNEIVEDTWDEGKVGQMLKWIKKRGQRREMEEWGDGRRELKREGSRE